MNQCNSITTKKAYGKIDLRLRKIMDEKGISRNKLARMIDARFEVIDKWYNNDVEKMDLDILARICYALECSPSEILEYNDN